MYYGSSGFPVTELESAMQRCPSMKFLASLAVATLAGLVLLAVHGIQEAEAQSRIIWDEPVNLSDSESSSVAPAIVADDFGFVHVFWSEDVGGESLSDSDLTTPGNAISYRRWDGRSWTRPVDVLSVPGENTANFVAVDVDSAGRLHVIFGGQSDFYYSSANGSEAEDARAWDTPTLIAGNNARSSWESDIVAAEDGVLHVVFATRGSLPGIFYIQSTDGGANWSEPDLVSEPLDLREEGFANVRLIADARGRLHASWETFQAEGYGQGVYYARSVDGGRSWEQPIRFDYLEESRGFVSWIYVTARGDDELHVIYANGFSSQGRGYRFSNDGGATWSAEQDVLMDMEGINGFVTPLVDGDQQLHMIVNMRTADTQVVGIYYTYKTPGGWAPTTPVDADRPATDSAHYAASTVRLGNEIHTVYTQLGGGEIWHVSGTIADVPQTAPLALPVTHVTQMQPTVLPTASPAPTPRPTLLPSFNTAVTPTDTTAFSILAPMVLTLVFLFAAATIALRRR
jgi:hypothetical protein